jgi:hypothetical protein
MEQFDIVLFTGIAQKDQTVASQAIQKNDRVFLDIASANIDVSFVIAS